MLQAATTRDIKFVQVHPTTKMVTARETVEAGTIVYVRPRKNGRYDLRVPGTMLTQTVYAPSLELNI